MLNFENKDIVLGIYVLWSSCQSNFTKFSSCTRLSLRDAAWAWSECWTGLGLPASVGVFTASQFE